MIRKLMTASSALVVGLILSTSAFAAGGTEVGVYFGIKNADVEVDNTTADINSELGFMGGMLAVGEMGGIAFRTGGYLAQRNFSIDAGAGGNADIKTMYIDVPVTALFKFNEMLGAFAGAVLSIKATDDCSGPAGICDSVDLNSFMASASFGLHAKFHPNWSGDISYELGLNDMADDTKANAISVGAAFLY